VSLLGAAFGSVVESSWRLSFLIIAILALRALLRLKAQPGAFYWAWVAVALLLVLPVSIPVSWSRYGLIRPVHQDLGAVAVRAPAAEMSGLAGVNPGEQRAPAQVQDSRAAQARSRPFYELLPALWIMGVFMLAVMRVASYFIFVRKLRLSRASAAPLPKAVASRLGTEGQRLSVTDAVGTPGVFGLVRTTMLFPPGLLERLSPQEARLVIAHELGHIRRRDLLTHVLIDAARIVHWFNPLVWIAALYAGHDCELACDEFVISRLGPNEAHEYGATLLKVLGATNRIPRVPVFVGILESRHHIKRRIQMIAANRPAPLVRILAGAALLFLLIGFGLTRESRAQQQQQAPTPTPELKTTASEVTTKAPPGWWKNGTNAADYVVGIDGTVTHDGLPSAYVRSVKPEIEGFGGMMQMCSAEKFAGKRLRYSAWMKTEDATDRGVHLWFRVDSKQAGDILQFDNMDDRRVKGTTDWKLYSLVLDVPADSEALAYGVFVQGTGRAWVSNLKIEEVGLDVPSTNTWGKARKLPDAPVNLGFSSVEKP
jgi:beta-lactamase regulating signal transducer with metallopeptidase domain